MTNFSPIQYVYNVKSPFVVEKNDINQKKETNSKINPQKKDSNKKDIIELQKKLTKALEEENYELAAEIRDLINKKSKK